VPRLKEVPEGEGRLYTYSPGKKEKGVWEKGLPQRTFMSRPMRRVYYCTEDQKGRGGFKYFTTFHRNKLRKCSFPKRRRMANGHEEMGSVWGPGKYHRDNWGRDTGKKKTKREKGV